MNKKTIHFDRNNSIDFYKTLQKRVRLHFKENKLTRFGNFSMYLKSAIMVALYIVPFIFILTIVDSLWLTLLMWIIMAIGVSGIGLSVMHDASHGAYSKHKWLNSLMGGSLALAGGSDTVWDIQHNVLHHTYTNITGFDEDIAHGFILRFSPHEKRKSHHKYQHIYAWFLYGLMTLKWITTKDFEKIFRYRREGLTNTKKNSFPKTVSFIIFSKVMYYGVFLVLPLIFSPVAWYWTIVGFLLMHLITGFILALIFQSAHVMPSSNYPMPDESGNIKADWAVSQLFNTCNFAPKSKLFSWFVGGLNFQIEHHLFPNICHVHYKKIAKIVCETAKEYDLPYYSEKTFYGAVKKHGAMLRILGTRDSI